MSLRSQTPLLSKTCFYRLKKKERTLGELEGWWVSLSRSTAPQERGVGMVAQRRPLGAQSLTNTRLLGTGLRTELAAPTG